MENGTKYIQNKFTKCFENETKLKKIENGTTFLKNCGTSLNMKREINLAHLKFLLSQFTYAFLKFSTRRFYDLHAQYLQLINFPRLQPPNKLITVINVICCFFVLD